MVCRASISRICKYGKVIFGLRIDDHPETFIGAIVGTQPADAQMFALKALLEEIALDDSDCRVEVVLRSRHLATVLGEELNRKQKTPLGYSAKPRKTFPLEWSRTVQLYELYGKGIGLAATEADNARLNAIERDLENSAAKYPFPFFGEQPIVPTVRLPWADGISESQ
jgi:hypothetical protein